MTKKTTPLRSIRLKCIDCMGGSPSEVRRCNIPECSLYQYRFGTNPSLKGKRGNGQALKKYRLSRKHSCIDKGDLKDTPLVNSLV
jgi:hypothetical protein